MKLDVMIKMEEKQDKAVEMASNMLRVAGQLPYVVQVKMGRPVWESIAAFNVLAIAEQYANQAAARGDMQYRVVLISNPSEEL